MDCAENKLILDLPVGVNLMDYQENAITAWKNMKYCGFYDMATGTGKTFTALASISQLAKDVNNNLAIFIVCPYKHLVDQWEDDVIIWGATPIIGHSDSHDKDWESKLIKSYKRYKQNGKPFICITTNRSFTGTCIQDIMDNIQPEMNILLVIDEVHNFGAEYLRKKLPGKVKYRLGLSATIERHMDKAGTDALMDYFGEKCIVYGIDEAIKDGKSLCPYQYHPICVFLTEDEKNKYEVLTRRLKDYIIFEDGVATISEAGKVILFQRSRILAGAINKKYKLIELIEPYVGQKNILVYCGATNDVESEKKQVDEITEQLNNMGIVTHRFTAEENAAERLEIKKMYAAGMYQALTAIRCLDEGVNIPGIETAFILSSSRNPKEYVQRRGRLLRKSPGKEKAVIYDFVIMPTPLSRIKFGDFDLDKNVVLGELARVHEFGRLSLNSAESDIFISEILEAYGVENSFGELLEEMEESTDELWG